MDNQIIQFSGYWLTGYLKEITEFWISCCLSLAFTHNNRATTSASNGKSKQGVTTMYSIVQCVSAFVTHIQIPIRMQFCYLETSSV